MNDILHDKEMDELLDNCHDTNGGIYNQIVTSNQDAPSTEKIFVDNPHPNADDLNCLKDQLVYTNNLKDLTGNNDDDIIRKTGFMDK